MKNSLFIVSGPSGAGEDSIINGLEKLLPIERVVTTTTRSMRPGESNGHPYYFISQEEFETGIKEGKFFEWARQYNDNLYGVTNEEINRVKEIDRVGIWKIEFKGVLTAKSLMPGVVSILINAPLDSLAARIKNRDKNITDQYLRERMEYTLQWLQFRHVYNYEVMNEDGKLEEAIKKTLKIIKSHL